MANSTSASKSRKTVIELRSTRRTELINITGRVQEFVSASGISTGVCHVYVPHTTAGVIINEGYDPDVAHDMEMAFDKLVPDDRHFRHAEGNSDSHIKVALTATSQSIFIENGKLALGRWQVVFFCEFDGPRQRSVHLKIVPDPA
jgi:secondary thiamine-phosphate synthase enzyme